jgi:hypothetical protein
LKRIKGVDGRRNMMEKKMFELAWHSVGDKVASPKYPGLHRHWLRENASSTLVECGGQLLA